MLDEEFIGRLSREFPSFYTTVDREARDEAAAFQKETEGDLARALQKARIRGAGRLWWPYVKGSVPFIGNDRPAMEGFARIVLTVDHLVGRSHPSAEEAGDHVAAVLRESLDHERLRQAFDRKMNPEAEAGVIAGAAGLVAPLIQFRRLKKASRIVPVPVRVALAAVILAALASVPLVAGYSAGRKAEERSRGDVEDGKRVVDTTAKKDE